MKTIKPQEITDIICNGCGKSCNAIVDSKSNLDKSFEYMELHAHWGYFSNKDCTKWEADFCETCSDKIFDLIKSMGGKISVETGLHLL